MSTKMLMANGTRYPVNDVFPDGVLDEVKLFEYGLPKLTGTFAFAMFMANAAVCFTIKFSTRTLTML